MKKLDAINIAENSRIAVIDAFSDAPLDFSKWHAAIDGMRRELDLFSIHLAFRLNKEDRYAENVYASGCDISSFVEEYFDLHTSANPIEYDSMVSGKIYMLEDFCRGNDLSNCDLYLDHLRPHGLGGLDVVAIGPQDGPRAHLAWTRRSDRAPLKGEQRAWLISLLPQIERSFEIFRQMRLMKVANEFYADALDNLSFGALAINHRRQVLFSNLLARDLMKRCDELTYKDGRLIFRKTGHNKIICSLLEVSNEERGESRESQILRFGANGSNIVALVRPVEMHSAPDSVVSARAVIYLHDLDSKRRHSIQGVATLFGLSPVEAKLAVLLSEGVILRDAAIMLDVTESSVRSYCKRIFSKMNVSRQVDIVRLVQRSIAIFEK